MLSQLTDGLAWTLEVGGHLFAAVEVGNLPGSAASGCGAGRSVVHGGRQAARDAGDGGVVASWPQLGRGRRCLSGRGGHAENAAFFGRPGVNRVSRPLSGEPGWLGTRSAAHTLFAAEVGRSADSEATLTERLLAQLKPGMLLLADRGFFS